jgi:hypothetical protein
MALGGSRTLKLSILADVDDLKKNLSAGSTEVEGFGSKLGDFSKKAGIAFAAAGAAAAVYAGKLLVDGVKAAIEDEAAQAKLATTLQNVTGATDKQIAATEAFILQTSLATGVADDELRPSLERLTRATKDVEEAQKLQSLALDIAAGSGKSLEAVSNALGKSAEGQNTALGKLGIGIDAVALRTMSFDEIQKALAETFGGQAGVAAETFQGKMDRLKVAFDEGKETVGAFVLDAITPMVTLFVEKVVPVISELSTTIGEKLGPTFSKLATIFKDDVLPIITAWWDFLSDTIIPGITAYVTPIIEGLFEAFDSIATAIADNEEKLKPLLKLFKSVAEFVAETLAPALGEVLGAAIKVIAKLVSGLVGGFSDLIGFINDVVNGIKSIINLVKNNPIVKGIGGVIDKVFGGGKAAGGPVRSGTSYLVGERGPELFTPNASGMITPNNKLGSGGGTTININVSGAFDPEGTARSIVNVLNNSFYRGTGGANNLQLA